MHFRWYKKITILFLLTTFHLVMSNLSDINPKPVGHFSSECQISPMTYFHRKFIKINNSYCREETVDCWFMLNLACTAVYDLKVKQDYHGIYRNWKTTLHSHKPRASTLHQTLHIWPWQVIGWVFILIEAVIVILHLE